MALRRKPFRRWRRRGRRRRASTSNLERKITAITLKNCETKQVSDWFENIQLQHNRTNYTLNKLLKLQQGVLSPDAFNMPNQGQYARIGDSVIARGIKVKLWLSNKADRPNVMYNIYAYTANPVYPVNDLHFWRGSDGAGGNMNRMVDAPNTALVKIKKKLKVFSGASYYNGATTSPNGREHSYFREFYIPLNNRKIIYNDGGNAPQKHDVNIAIVAYDAYGTLPADTIGSFTGSYTYYFKDP